jgi:hypothetical protein
MQVPNKVRTQCSELVQPAELVASVPSKVTLNLAQKYTCNTARPFTMPIARVGNYILFVVATSVFVADVDSATEIRRHSGATGGAAVQPSLSSSSSSSSSAAAACGTMQKIDCDGEDIGSVTNATAVMTPAACCEACTRNPRCAVAVLVSPWHDGLSTCLMKSGCSAPSPLNDRVMICPLNSTDPTCHPPPPPPGTQCPCSTCPCVAQQVLPRT